MRPLTHVSTSSFTLISVAAEVTSAAVKLGGKKKKLASLTKVKMVKINLDAAAVLMNQSTERGKRGELMGVFKNSPRKSPSICAAAVK